MRSSHDPYDFAAPSPIVPTSRTRQSHKANSFNMSASTARHVSSIANGDTDSKPLRLLGIIADGNHPESPTKDSDVADLIRCLQSPSAATITSTSAVGSASATSLLTTTSGSGARDMFKAGHRRLRQLAQRQRKDVDPSKADEEARQLSALHREGLLPSAAPAPSLRRSPAKRKSAESSPANPAFTTHHQSNSRRDVERIGQPWLADPLERCMLDTLSSTGRLSSLDLGDLAAFMDSATLDEPQPKSKPEIQSQLKPQPQTQSEPQQQPHQQQQPPQPQSQPQPESESIPELDTTKPESVKTDSTEKKDEKEKEKDKRPQLKLFPDPLPPPRISSKTARRLSKCPPAQPAGLPPVTELPSPPKADKEQSSADPPASSPVELPAQDDQLPMHAIKAMFPLPAPTRPAPTRPLPAVPEITPSESTRTNTKKTGHSSPSLGSVSLASQSPVLHQSPEPMRQSPPQTSQSHLQVTPSEPERRPRPFSFEASGENNDSRQSVDLNQSNSHGHGNKERPQSPSTASSPPTLSSPRRLKAHTKRSAPSLVPDPKMGSQIRRSNSVCGRVLRSGGHVPSSDDEGRAQRKPKRLSPSSSPQHKKNSHRHSRMSVARAAPPSPTRSPPPHHYSNVHTVDSHAHTNAHVQVLQARVAHLKRQNKVLQAALLAALDAGNKDPSFSDGFMLSPPGSGSGSSRVLAPAPAPTPVSRITPPSSLTTSASSMDERESEPRDDSRDTWLDLESRSRSSSGSSGSSSSPSFDFGATTKALEGIHDVDFGWLSDRSSFVH